MGFICKTGLKITDINNDFDQSLKIMQFFEYNYFLIKI